jgi:hypothetical protein
MAQNFGSAHVVLLLAGSGKVHQKSVEFPQGASASLELVATHDD